MLVSTEIGMSGYTFLWYRFMQNINKLPERVRGVYGERFRMDHRVTHRTIAAALLRLRGTGNVPPRHRTTRTRSNIQLTGIRSCKFTLCTTKIKLGLWLHVSDCLAIVTWSCCATTLSSSKNECWAARNDDFNAVISCSTPCTYRKGRDNAPHPSCF